MRHFAFIAALAFVFLCAGFAEAESGSPQELGVVNWHRSYKEAAAISEETGKPLFILFQEVPGCSQRSNT